MTPALRERYLAKLKRLGQLSFQQRLEALFDPGTCELLNAADWDQAWGLAVVCAEGKVEGRACLAYASNFAIDEGTIGKAEALDVVALLQRAARERVPVVALLHSNGARVAERYDALAGNAELFKEVTRLSGVVPQLAACMGLCLGVAAYLAALADFTWMIPDQSYTATTSPSVVRVATSQSVAWDDLGGAAMHAATSGVAHFLADDDAACLARIRQVLGMLGGDRPPVAAPDVDLDALVPTAPQVPFEVRKLVQAVFDRDSFLEVHAHWGKSLVVGLARLEGRAVGVVANQSRVRSGVIDVEAARKGSRFAQVADSLGLPLIYLVDVPGIMVSVDQEQGGILDAGATFFHAVDTDVPRLAVVLRKCYGGAFVMMQARQAGGDRVFAYPHAQIGIAGPEVTFAIVHGKEHLTHQDADAFRSDSLTAIRRVPTDAYAAQAAGLVDKVITPRQTRAELAAALRELTACPPRVRYGRRHPNLPC